MLRAFVIAICATVCVPLPASAASFCHDWPVFKISDGTQACAAVFGPMQGKGFTAATGKFHMLSDYVEDKRSNDARGRALCKVYREQIIAKTRQVGLRTFDYIVIIQTWKVGTHSSSVDKVFNWTVVADKQCRSVRF